MALIPAPESCRFPKREGNEVRMHVDGVAAFGAIERAVDNATTAVWVTVAFFHQSFRFPSGRSMWDLLDAAGRRGVDVRVVFWRHNLETARLAGETFPGTPADHAHLDARGALVSARWDRADGADCHHQKSWVVDAGGTSPVAFVGGMNLNPTAMVSPGHSADHSQHDVYAEVRGPAVADVATNFVERWNGASDRDDPLGRHGPVGGIDLHAVSTGPAFGAATVQIQRTMPASRGGERTIHEQYLLAIDAAESSVHIENQSVLSPSVLGALGRALDRGVDVTLVVPMLGEGKVRAARTDGTATDTFAALDDLAATQRFHMVGVAAASGVGTVHVHAKVMIVDDTWATVGSCNLRDAGSFSSYSELNMAVWDPGCAGDLHRRLAEELTGLDLTAASGPELSDAIADAASRNHGLAAGDAGWAGTAVLLDPRSYGLAP